MVAILLRSNFSPRSLSLPRNMGLKSSQESHTACSFFSCPASFFWSSSFRPLLARNSASQLNPASSLPVDPLPLVSASLRINVYNLPSPLPRRISSPAKAVRSHGAPPLRIRSPSSSVPRNEVVSFLSSAVMGLYCDAKPAPPRVAVSRLP